MLWLETQLVTEDTAVFLAFLDASKAFDTTNHYLRLSK